MKAIVKQCWQYFKLGAGTLILLFALAPLVLPKSNSEHLERYNRLEFDGSDAIGKVTDKPTSLTRLPQTPLNKLGPAGSFASGFASGNRAADAMNGQPPKKDLLTLQDHYVAYEFRTPKDVVVTHEVPVSADEYKRLIVGAPISVRYHPENPNIHRLIDFSSPFPVRTFMQKLQGALLMAVIGGLLIWRGWPAGGTGPSSPSSPSRSSSPPAPAVRVRRAGFGQR